MKKPKQTTPDLAVGFPGKTPPAPIERTESQLDDAVRDVRQLRGDVAASGWRLGQRLRQIRESGIWKLRTEAGATTPRWSSFASFCHSECGITPGMADKLIEIATKTAEEQARAIGVTKLVLILDAPPEARPVIEQAARDGASKREVQERVREARDATGYRKGKGGRPRTPSAPPTAPLARREVVTTSLPAKGITVPLFCAEGVELSSRRARGVGDRPAGRAELLNDVTLFVAIVDTGAGLAVRLLPQRDES